jgi:hypothetical protein
MSAFPTASIATDPDGHPLLVEPCAAGWLVRWAHPRSALRAGEVIRFDG